MSDDAAGMSRPVQTRLHRLRSAPAWIAVILATLTVFGPLSMDLYLPVLPNLGDDLRTTTSAAQLTMTSCLLGLAFGQVVAGPLSDRYGRRGQETTKDAIVKHHEGRGGSVALTHGSVVLAALLVLTGCARADDAAPSPGSTEASPYTAPPSPPSTPEAPALSEEASVSTGPSVLISFGGTTVRGSLQDNAATASLLAQLPLQLSFTDFGGQEKIAPLPTPLSLEGMPSGSDAQPGTIGYYAPSQALVLYYDNVGYYNGIVPIGTFQDVETIRDAPAFTGTIAAG